jgi:nitroreductase
MLVNHMKESRTVWANPHGQRTSKQGDDIPIMTASSSTPVTDLIRQRYSCREYQKTPIEPEKQRRLAGFIAANQTGPLGSPTRFALAAAAEADRRALRGLGTYGFIKSPTCFILGAMGDGEKNLEDFGYAMERIILFATDLGLGTCWLGGSLTKSRFAKRISARKDERVPAVTSIGRIAKTGVRHHLPHGKYRLPRDRLFFDREFGSPLTKATAGAYETPLEMGRIGPSASNKQPWRIVRKDDFWHLYIERTPGYREWWIASLMNVDDMQRLDAGIAMCHLELAANELGLTGEWFIREPGIEKPNERTEYVASWVGEYMKKALSPSKQQIESSAEKRK